MKAVLLHGYGDVNQLRYEDAPDPVAGPGEVLVRVISTSINPVDYKIREGEMKAIMPLKFPAILGYDVAGEVVDVGDGVSGLAKGDRVMGVVEQSYAEYLTAKADILARVPQGLDASDAGALPLILITGAQLMEKGVKPVRGEKILVTGAAGSVGRTAVFVGKQHGAYVIAGVRLKRRDEAGEIGADAVVALDDDGEVQGLPELDAIADTVGGKTIGALLPKLKKSGRLATVLGRPDAARDLDVREVWAPDVERLYQLAEDVRGGKLRIPIARRMKLSDIREAHALAEKGGGGKIVLIP